MQKVPAHLEKRAAAMLAADCCGSRSKLHWEAIGETLRAAYRRAAALEHDARELRLIARSMPARGR